MCVDHFSRYVILATVKEKTVSAIAHALICPYSTLRVLLSDTLLEKICKLFSIKQTIMVTYHPAINSLVKCANRKIFEILHPVVNGLLDNWEDWLPHVAASINGSNCE